MELLNDGLESIITEYKFSVGQVEDVCYCPYCAEFIPIIADVGVHLNVVHPDGWQMSNEGRC